MIRACGKRDAQAVCDIWNPMIRDTLATFTSVNKTAHQIETLIRARAEAFFVFEDKDRITGFATFGPFRSGDGYAQTVEHSIVVRPTNTGRGVGQALMAHTIEAAAKQGNHVMVGAISSANPKAIAFHGKLGFEHAGLLLEVGRKNGRWLDLVLMQKILTPPS